MDTLKKKMEINIELLLQQIRKNKEVLKKYTELLNKILKLHMLKVIVRSVFQEHGKYYLHILLDECL